MYLKKLDSSLSVNGYYVTWQRSQQVTRHNMTGVNILNIVIIHLKKETKNNKEIETNDLLCQSYLKHDQDGTVNH